MINLNQFAAILFDMDGLLLDTETIALRLFAKIVEESGFIWSDDVGLQIVGRNARDADALLRAHYGTDFAISEIRKTFLERYEVFLRQSGVPLKPGVKQLLKELQQKGMLCALVTSSRRRLTELKLNAAAISQYFTVRICGDDVESGKPHPQCYLLAAAKLGVPARQCLVLEDSNPGIEAALAAGMHAWWVPDKTRATQELQERGAVVFSNLRQVQKALFSR